MYIYVQEIFKKMRKEIDIKKVVNYTMYAGYWKIHMSKLGTLQINCAK